MPSGSWPSRWRFSPLRPLQLRDAADGVRRSGDIRTKASMSRTIRATSPGRNCPLRESISPISRPLKVQITSTKGSRSIGEPPIGRESIEARTISSGCAGAGEHKRRISCVRCRSTQQRCRQPWTSNFPATAAAALPGRKCTKSSAIFSGSWKPATGNTRFFISPGISTNAIGSARPFTALSGFAASGQNPASVRGHGTCGRHLTPAGSAECAATWTGT